MPTPIPLTLPPSSLTPHGLIPRPLSLTPRPSCRIVTEKKMKIWKKKCFLSLAKQVLDPDPEPDPHQLEKWDRDPHQNVLDMRHWFDE